MLRRTFIVTLLLAFGCSSPLAQQSQRGKGKGPKPPPEPVEMGSRFYDTYDRHIDNSSGAVYPWDSLPSSGGGAVTSPSRGGRSRDHSLSIQPSQIRDYDISTSPGLSSFDVDNVYVSLYVYKDATQSAGEEIVVVFDTASARKLHLEWASSDKLELFDSTGTSLGVGTTSLSNDTWYRLDVRCGTGASATYGLRVHQDGSPGTSLELSGTGNLGTNQVGLVSINPVPGPRTDYHAHVVVNDSEYVADGSDYRIETLFPNGDGNYTAWTGDWTDVDDVKHDGTTTEITTSDDLNRQTVTLEDLPTLAAGESVLSVMNVYHMRKVDNAAVNVQVIDRSGGTDRDSASFLLAKNDGGDRDQRWFVIYDTKPGGGSWTESDVNGYEIGLEHNQAQSRAIFCTAMNCNVLIEMPAAGDAGATLGEVHYPTAVNIGTAES